MPITQLLLLKVPPFILGLVIIGGAIGLSVAGLFIVRVFIHHSKLKAHHDVADPILGAVSAVYAVLLAFVTVTVWQNFDKSNSNVALEANYLADIYRDSAAFSPDFNQKVSRLLHEYKDAVINNEWKTMARGEMSPEVDELMKKIWGLYTNYEPRNLTEQAFFDESVRKLNSFTELRRQRILDSKTGIHPLLWFVLVLGAVSTIGFTFLFGTENLKAQIVMGVLLSAMISLILFTILSLDFPFTGSVTISTEPFKQILLD